MLLRCNIKAAGALRLKPDVLLHQRPLRRRPTATFCTATGGADKMESKQEQEESDKHVTGDVMSHSFGEGYSTRADEEGFGGVYGGNQTLRKDKNPPEPEVHEDHPEYDRSQGSEVAEKERARNQSMAR